MEQEYILMRKEEVHQILHELSMVMDGIQEVINEKKLEISRDNECVIKFDSNFLFFSPSMEVEF